MTERAIIHSYGGGVQSAAIAVLVVQGRLPRPERIVMADTGREAAETWDYLADSVQPLLSPLGLSVDIAPHSLATVDLYPSSGGSRPLIPVFTGDGAKLPTFCSVEWKRRVVGRYLRSLGYGPDTPITEWLGISKDEVERAKDSRVEWIAHSWPLLDLNLSRADCIQIVRDHGLPEPPRSSCWMCPHRSDAEWMHLRDHGDGDYQRAVEFDHSLPADLFLHRSHKRIDQITFRHEHQGGLFDVCEEGRCEF